MPRFTLHIVTITPKTYGQGRRKEHRVIAVDADDAKAARAEAEARPGVRVNRLCSGPH